MRGPRAGALAESPRLLSIALHSKMSDGNVDRVIDAVKELVAKHRSGKTWRLALPHHRR